MTKPTPRFDNVSCSQCGGDFGPGNHGFSHCQDHQHPSVGLQHHDPTPGALTRVYAESDVNNLLMLIRVGTTLDERMNAYKSLRAHDAAQRARIEALEQVDDTNCARVFGMTIAEVRALTARIEALEKESADYYVGLKELMGALVDAGGAVNVPSDYVQHAKEIRRIGARLEVCDATITTLQGEVATALREQERLEGLLRGEPLLHSLTYAPGQPLDIAISHPLVAAIAQSAADMLIQRNAENYLEMSMSNKAGERFTFTIQRENRPTPHELRKQAEAQLAQLQARDKEKEQP